MSILVILIILMAIVYGVEFALKPDEATQIVSTDSIRLNFIEYIGLFYQFMLGENPYKELSFTGWIVYLIFTVLVQIVALNLLIALLSETFANVYATINANHCRTQVEILLEICGFGCLYAREDKDMKCLHFVSYSTEKIG